MKRACLLLYTNGTSQRNHIFGFEVQRTRNEHTTFSNSVMSDLSTSSLILFLISHKLVETSYLLLTSRYFSH